MLTLVLSILAISLFLTVIIIALIDFYTVTVEYNRIRKMMKFLEHTMMINDREFAAGKGSFQYLFNKRWEADILKRLLESRGYLVTYRKTKQRKHELEVRTREG